jgi:hypothetical protein
MTSHRAPTRPFKLALHDSIAEYVATQAGTKDDLDPDLERAAVERLALCHQITTLHPCETYEATGRYQGR